MSAWDAGSGVKKAELAAVDADAGLALAAAPPPPPVVAGVRRPRLEEDEEEEEEEKPSFPPAPPAPGSPLMLDEEMPDIGVCAPLRAAWERSGRLAS